MIGYGSVGKQLYNTLLENGYTAEQVYIFDDNVTPDEQRRIFKFSDYKEPRFSELHFIPTLGYLSKMVRYNVLNYLIENGFKIFSFVHPTAFVSKNATIGRGVIIYPMCNIDQGCVVEDGAIILNSSIVAHDTVIGKCSYLAPGVCISGFVKVEELCFIGTSATLANNITVGRNSTVAMGTCLTKDIPEGTSVIGNPFKIKRPYTIVLKRCHEKCDHYNRRKPRIRKGNG